MSDLIDSAPGSPPGLGQPGGDDLPDFGQALGRAVLGQVVGLVPVGIVEVDEVDGRDAGVVERQMIVENLAAHAQS